MNRKAADFNAGMYIFVIICYFIAFSFIVTAVTNMTEETSKNFTQDNIYSSLTYQLGRTSFSYCDDPRLRYKFGSSEGIQISEFNANYLRCDWSRGLQSESDCNAISGCNWTNINNGFSIFGLCLWGCDTLKSCVGNMDVSAYNISKLIDSRSSPYKYYDFYNQSTEYNNLLRALGINENDEGTSICSYPTIILNKTSCAYFDCTWKTITPQKDASLFKISTSLLSITGDLFTFSYDFGFSSAINTLMYLIFILLPLIFLIICIVYAIAG
jgi:hypothetical protein